MTNMSANYDVVTAYHAAGVALADAKREAATAEAAATAALAVADAKVERVAELERALGAARAAVETALRGGRIVSARHLLDLPADCLGEIMGHLDADDVRQAVLACTALREAAERSSARWRSVVLWPDTQTVQLETILAKQPSPRVRKITLHGDVEPSNAALLRAVLDASPPGCLLDVCWPLVPDDTAHMVSAFRGARNFGVSIVVDDQFDDDDDDGIDFNAIAEDMLRRVLAAAVPVTRLQWSFPGDTRLLAACGSTLTALYLKSCLIVELPSLPMLRYLKINTIFPPDLTTEQRSLTAADVAPRLTDVEISSYCSVDDVGVEPIDTPFENVGTGEFWRALGGVTRIKLAQRWVLSRDGAVAKFPGIENLRSLRVIEYSWDGVSTEPSWHAVATVPLAPSLTRVVASGGARIQFHYDGTYASLRVLDLRGAASYTRRDDRCDVAFPWFDGTLPRLHTLLVGYAEKRAWRPQQPLPFGFFNLYTLLAAQTALRMVVIERAVLSWTVPANAPPAHWARLADKPEDLVTSRLADRLSQRAPYLRSVHWHGCIKDEDTQRVVLAFQAVLKERARVCKAGLGECMFCRLFDGERGNEDEEWADGW